MKMTLLYDLTASQPNVDGRFHGGGKYAKKVFLELLNHISYYNIIPIYNSQIELEEELTEAIKNKSLSVLDVSSLNFDKEIQEVQAEKFYSALPRSIMHKIPKLKNCQMIGTIHGLRDLELPISKFSLKYTKDIGWITKVFLNEVFKGVFFARSKRKYTEIFDTFQIVTVSHHTKFAIESFFPHIKTEIPVFYSPDVSDLGSGQEKIAGIEYQDFYLMVSGNRWIKNNLIAAKALDQLFTEHPNLRRNVIITGVNNPAIYTSQLKNKDFFIFFDYVEESFLVALYKRAFVFIYLSLNEGFGYPPLESMKHGVPVITNSFTSIYEICDNAVLYSNPFSISEIKNRLLQVNNKEIYEKYKKRSLSRFEVVKKKQEHDLEAMVKYLTN